MATNQEKKVADDEKFFSKLGISLTSLRGARQAIEANRCTGNVICLVGPAGIGKTHITRQVAAARKPTKPFEWHGQRWEESVPLVPLYLAHMQAEDMGVPYPSRAKRNELLRECELFMNIGKLAQNGFGEKARDHALKLAEEVLDRTGANDAATFEFLIEKRLSDLPPEGILFLDEWNRAEKQVIKAFFTLLEDREIHGHRVVPDGVQIVAAMNPSDGAYSVNEAEKDHAFRRRLDFVAVTCNAGAWLEYATSRFHPHVVEFVKSMPNALYDTALRDAGKAFPCPATWEKVSRLLQETDRAKLPLLTDGIELSVCGLLGQAHGMQFMGYIKDSETVINPDEVVKKYTDKSAVRRKVLKLVDQNRNDVLNELCASVALTLLTDKPDPMAIAPQISLFMGDLQPEIAVSFIVHKLSAASEHAEGSEGYLNNLSIAMHDQPSYKKLFQAIGSAMEKARQEVSDGKGADPLEP
jgi:hypothetical protein